ncbi:hypothetical protein CTRG_04788 [Candida tropicalis MYA-3404]|uniref:PHD-type domain-containing protein n=1 Tax=Candida tropicalis (strain ATCC MYA-3404 / T1) TaxID=294747 RepID=C5MFE5_CANTT|nr:hypothetical protein CTRG_04788 [Candida tropicalis MYA-3404]EER32005.1 hypothetical protein CTRG_04788 [Candida tropicalis MYA-3404]KAG4405596.1 hypothetical protein JTP64_005632 [Candida tropicalis]
MAVEEEEWNPTNDSRNGSPEYNEGTAKKRKTATPSATTIKKSKQNHQRSSSPSLEETQDDIAKQYKRFISAPKYDLNSEELFCVCRKPDLGEMMVACDGCEEWFHFECMKVNPKYSELIVKFYCKFCQWKELGESQWKRKCRIIDCYKPIDNGSKYCSKEHGLQFMKNLLIDSTTKEDSPTSQELNSRSIKDIINYVSGDYKKLQDLGAKFPELKSVVEYKQDPKNLNNFPEDVKHDLQTVHQKYDQIQSQIKEQEEVLDTMSTMKENIKQVNERLTNIIFQDSNQDTSQSSKKKKKKPAKGKKKIDLCLCDKSNQYLVKQIIESESMFEKLAKIIKKRYAEDEDEDEEKEEEEEEEEEVVDSDWFMEDLCIKDKKKCARHNGWWNLYNDEAENNLESMKVKSNTISEQEEKILRNYSVKVYES